MALERFTLKTLVALDGGRLRAAFDEALKRLYDDCRDRPGLDTARTLALKVALKPVVEGGELTSVDVRFEFDTKVPKMASRNYNMIAVRGGLAVNDLSPENARQGTMDQVPGVTGAVSDDDVDDPDFYVKEDSDVG